LCFGEATKFSQYLLDSDKGYETLAQLGKTTTTADAEGEVLQERPVTVGRADVEAALPKFRGQIRQIPPMYSALKRDGQPLYKLARAGEVVEREPRSVYYCALGITGLRRRYCASCGGLQQGHLYSHPGGGYR
jgi:tRNA pseudouridine55 synthase